jgi:hypothetical protein
MLTHNLLKILAVAYGENGGEFCCVVPDIARFF